MDVWEIIDPYDGPTHQSAHHPGQKMCLSSNLLLHDLDLPTPSVLVLGIELQAAQLHCNFVIALLKADRHSDTSGPNRTQAHSVLQHMRMGEQDWQQWNSHRCTSSPYAGRDRRGQSLPCPGAPSSPTRHKPGSDSV